MKVTDKEYEGMMLIREICYQQSESTNSKLLEIIADLMNRVALYVGKEYFNE